MWCTDYRLSDRWWNEPLLNIVAAAAQMSSLTHVEIAIGEEVGSNGMMSNVCRVFNDSVGVVRRQAPPPRPRRPRHARAWPVAQELVERTGRNPQYASPAVEPSPPVPSC